MFLVASILGMIMSLYIQPQEKQEEIEDGMKLPEIQYEAEPETESFLKSEDRL